MVIWFNSEIAKMQLQVHGEVITCRKGRKQFGVTSAIYTNEDGNSVVIDKVKVEYLYESIDLDREHNKAFKEYLDLSGFDSVDKWKNEVKKLNKNRWMPNYLIFLKVTVVDRYGS